MASQADIVRYRSPSSFATIARIKLVCTVNAAPAANGIRNRASAEKATPDPAPMCSRIRYILYSRVIACGISCARCECIAWPGIAIDFSTVLRSFLLFLIATRLALLPRCTGQIEKLTVATQPGELSLGGDCELICTAKKFGGRKVHWQKNNVQLTQPATVSQVNPSVSWDIEALKQSDEGTYTCVLTLNGATVAEESLYLLPPSKSELCL